MSSHGITDRVAVIGMGCTPFAEHWDASPRRPDHRRGPRRLPLSRHGPGRRRCLLVRYVAVGRFRAGHGRASQDSGQTRHPGGELLRHRLRGPAPGLLRGGLRGLRHRHGSRSREGQGRRLPGSQRLPHPHRRHPAHPHRRGHVQPDAARLRRPLRGRPRRVAPRRGPNRLEEPPQRRPQPARPVSPGDVG